MSFKELREKSIDELREELFILASDTAETNYAKN